MKPSPGNALGIHTKIRCPVRDELVGLFEGALVQQEVDALPRRKLSGFALPCAPLCAATLFGDGVARGKLCKVALMRIGLRCGRSRLNGMLGCGHRTRF